MVAAGALVGACSVCRSHDVSGNGCKENGGANFFRRLFHQGDPMLVKTDEFKAHFGNDYFVGVLTECDNHFTTQNLETLRDLSNELLDSLSYVDKITSLTDIEFLAGNEEGMAIEQIVPEVIPKDKAGLDSVKQRAYSKPEVARKLISKDGKLSWIVIKLRPFRPILYGKKRRRFRLIF